MAKEIKEKHPMRKALMVAGLVFVVAVTVGLLIGVVAVASVVISVMIGLLVYLWRRLKSKKIAKLILWTMLITVCGIVPCWIGIGGIDGASPKDDDLYLPPKNIPDDQNVMVALREIVGEGADETKQSNLCGRVKRESPNFGGVYPQVFEPFTCFADAEICFPLTIENEVGQTIATVSNREELAELVDAAIATNECIAVAIERAAKRPYYVNVNPLLPSFSICDLSGVIRLLYGARHTRFIETKRYDKAIEDDSTLLELAHKIMHGQSWLIDRMYACGIHSIAIARLAEIAKRHDICDSSLAEINAILSKYDIEDWKECCHNAVRGEYSWVKSALADYSSRSYFERIKWCEGVFAYSSSESKYLIPFMNYMLHPNHTLSKLLDYYRAQLALLHDYEALVSDAGDWRKNYPGSSVPSSMRPNRLGECLIHVGFGRNFLDIAELASHHRAVRIALACRRHFDKTGKLAGAIESISPEPLPNPIIDPVFNTQYAIKSWHSMGLANIAVFQRDATGSVVVLKEEVCRHDKLDDSQGEGCLVHMCWPADAIDGARNENGEVHHYKQDVYDYYTFVKAGIEWAYEVNKDGEARLGYRERCWTMYLGRHHGAIVGEVAGSVIVPSEICGHEVVGINAGAFAECTNITSITIPEGVRKIGLGAFLDCDRLERIICLGSPDCDSGAPIFDGCKSLRGITVKEDGEMNPLVKKAYMECQSLADAHGFAVYHGRLIKYLGKDSEIVVPSDVSSIEEGAFRDCANLTSVTLPKCVKKIGIRAFAGCSSLRQIRFLGDKPNNITDKRGPLMLFDRDINSNKCIVIKVVKGTNGWGWKARLFGNWNGFRIEFDEADGNDTGNDK